MARKPNESDPLYCAPLILLVLGLFSCAMVYTFLSTFLINDGAPIPVLDSRFTDKRSVCCRGIKSLELWGPVVKWGSDFKFNKSMECCKACKAMCNGNGGACFCDTWVFCGNKTACGSKFGECWLKKQKDSMEPDLQGGGRSDSWTSGLIFGKGEGIIGLETEYGSLHIKLLPECAPKSVFYILELLALRHCAGCHFYRAEGRGELWDVNGNHVKKVADPFTLAPFGPPFAVIQGTLEATGLKFSKIPKEACRKIERGSVAWVGGGPEFFISLANHGEWKKEYTVFGYVLPEDMGIAEKIAMLPTKADVWSHINVSVLEKPVPLKLRRVINGE